MRIDKARADLIVIKKAAEAATAESTSLIALSTQKEMEAKALRQEAMLLEAFIHKYGEDQPVSSPLPPWEPTAVAEDLPVFIGPPERVKATEARGARAKVTPEVMKTILAQRASGATMQEIANHFDLSIGTVNNWLQKHKRESANSGIDSPSRDESEQSNMLESY